MAKKMEVDRIIKNRVFVAGDSIYTPLGFTTQENMDSLVSYKSGIEEIDQKKLFHAPFMGSYIAADHADINIRENSGLSLLEKRIVVAVNNAVTTSCINDKDDFLKESLFILSTTKGNIDMLTSSESYQSNSVYLSNMAGKIASFFGSEIEPLVISNACISGVNAIITASRLIERGKYKHAIVVGADLLSHFVITGFQAFHSVSPIRCKPYDINRDGLSLGEAVGVIILTSEKEFCREFDPIVVEGGAVTNDANHLSAPSRTGDGLGNAILESMKIAGVIPDEIDFINAHGTATLYNDEMESKAIHWAGLQEKKVQSLKPYWGHTLGASGVIESIACFWQIKNNILLATLGFEIPGVPMEINVSGEHRLQNSRRCVKTASGFGGCNAAVVFSKESETKNTPIALDKLWEKVDEYELKGDSGFSTTIRELNKETGNKELKFFKMDDLSKLGSTGAMLLLRNHPEIENIPKEKRGIFMANFSSSLNSDIRHLTAVESQGDTFASPAIFVYTLPNIVIGEICIRNKFQGENTFFILPKDSRENAGSLLLDLAGETNLEIVIIGWCEQIGEFFDLKLELYKCKKYE